MLISLAWEAGASGNPASSSNLVTQDHCWLSGCFLLSSEFEHIDFQILVVGA